MTKDFDVDGICRIIEVCGRSGVREFHAGRIKLLFGNVVQAPDLEPLFIPPAVERAIETQTRESIEKEEINLKREELEQMVIEDPARFEELIRSGDLILELLLLQIKSFLL